jgi:hypothetical protein
MLRGSPLIGYADLGIPTGIGEEESAMLEGKCREGQCIDRLIRKFVIKG